jgi:hypothetical protein
MLAGYRTGIGDSTHRNFGALRGESAPSRPFRKRPDGDADARGADRMQERARRERGQRADCEQTPCRGDRTVPLRQRRFGSRLGHDEQRTRRRREQVSRGAADQ